MQLQNISHHDHILSSLKGPIGLFGVSLLDCSGLEGVIKVSTMEDLPKHDDVSINIADESITDLDRTKRSYSSNDYRSDNRYSTNERREGDEHSNNRYDSRTKYHLPTKHQERSSEDESPRRYKNQHKPERRHHSRDSDTKEHKGNGSMWSNSHRKPTKKYSSPIRQRTPSPTRKQRTPSPPRTQGKPSQHETLTPKKNEPKPDEDNLSNKQSPTQERVQNQEDKCTSSEKSRKPNKSERNNDRDRKKHHEDHDLHHSDDDHRVGRTVSSDIESDHECEASYDDPEVVDGHETVNSDEQDSGDETFEDVEEIEDEDDEPSISSYAARRGSKKTNGKEMFPIMMPTGKKSLISTPITLGWKIGDKTKLITLKPNGVVGKHELRAISEACQKTIKRHEKCWDAGGCFSHYKIVKVQKVINGLCWEKYKLTQAEIVKENGFANERMLFHGSAKVSDIVKAGFNEQHSKMNGMFGAGIYFAKHSSKSNQYAFGYMGGTGCPKHGKKGCYICPRKMLLCRVILGRSYEVTTAAKVPHAPLGYNSVVGIPSDAKRGLKFPEYIVYRREQAYPEYIITYKIAK